jgi:WS/DGAT/MGAT family acyltransferase
MAYAHFERLSAMDMSFLAMEDGRCHMHIGSVSIFEKAPLRGPDGGIDIERIFSFYEAQLHKVPRLRQKLQWVPGFEQPVWVDDARFNLRFHVRHTALPPPGDERLLKRLAGRIFSQEFDRGKPLWETYFVDGLADDRLAVVSKMHHCLADGVSGVKIGTLLVGANPDYEPKPPRPWVPRPAPGDARLVLEELRHRVGAPFDLVRAAAQRAGEKKESEEPSQPRPGLRAMLESAGAAFRGSASTPLNVEIGPHRRFDWIAFPFAEVRAIGKAVGGTLNDGVLAIASGALRAFLQRRGEAVDDLDFHAVVPVSVRQESEQGALGNRVSGLLARLPVDEPDPMSRLERVVETTRELKASGQSGAGDLVAQALDLLPNQLLMPIFRSAASNVPANVVITNVPGARVPVYMLGARQLAAYPVVPLTSNQALGIALLSYDTQLCWGFNADWDAVPDLHELVGDVQESFEELRRTVGSPETDAPEA